MFLHMVAHFFTVASMGGGRAMSSAALNEVNVDLQAAVQGGRVVDRLFAWVPKATVAQGVDDALAAVRR